MLNYLKRIFYNFLFTFPFFQKLFYINDKILFFNLTFFFKKRQLFKKKRIQKVARISLFTLFINKIARIQFRRFTLSLALNFTFKLFVKILKNFIFSLILIYYFFTFLINLFLLALKYIYHKFLKVKLFIYKNCYNFLDYFGFRTFFFFYNVIYFFTSTILVLLIFAGFFYFFKINYFNTDYFYVNFFSYNNDFDTNFLSTKQIYYYRFSLWWIFRIYLLYTLLYIFVKDLRDLIKTHLMFIIFLPIVICNFNFKFFIYLMLSSFIDIFGSIKINQDQFFIKRLKKLPLKRITLDYTNKRFNFLFSSGLLQESRRLRVLQTSANNNLVPIDVVNLNLRDESTSYKSEILRLKKLKAIQNYYLDFKIISKKNKILQTLHSDLLRDKFLYGLKPSQDYYYKFFHTSNFFTINRKNDILDLLKKNTNGLIKISPYLDIKLLNTDNYRTFKTNNYFPNNHFYDQKLDAFEHRTGNYPWIVWTAYNKNFYINYTKVDYIYELFYELNNKKLKQKANKLILDEKFEDVIDDGMYE